jgi:hypothetical protein
LQWAGVVGEFYLAWEEWVLADRADASQDAWLNESYRGAWANGDDHDRYAILYYVYDGRHAEAYDLLVAGLVLESTVAVDAAAIVLSLIYDGVALGPDVHTNLEACGRRFPDSSFAPYALELLFPLNE